MKKFIFIFLLFAALFPAFPPPRVEAMDPVTMALLAPVAMKVAEAAKPYIIKSIIGTGTGLLKIGKDIFQFLYFPYGLCEMTFGAPFHKFHSGVVHAIRGGAIAPIKFFLHIVLLPVYMSGAQINL